MVLCFLVEWLLVAGWESCGFVWVGLLLCCTPLLPFPLSFLSPFFSLMGEVFKHLLAWNEPGQAKSYGGTSQMMCDIWLGILGQLYDLLV
jgi:hypothetical protein